MINKTTILLAILFSAISIRAIEPTEINLTHSGKINWIHYDFSAEESVYPLSGLYFSGKGEVKYIRINFKGNTLLLDQYGKSDYSIVGPLEVVKDSDGKVERLKEGISTVLKFSYDLDGRLVAGKDESFTTLFKLKYDLHGQLQGIDKGNLDYLVRFYYGLDDQITGIKDGDYQYIYKIKYNSDGQLDRIKNAEFKDLASVRYEDDKVSDVITTGINARISIGEVNIEYLSGYSFDNQSEQAPKHFAVFYEHSGHTGNNLFYRIGEYSKLPSEWNDKISSIYVPKEIKVIVYEQENFEGRSMELTEDWSAQSPDDFWNDRISSIKVLYR